MPLRALSSGNATRIPDGCEEARKCVRVREAPSKRQSEGYDTMPGKGEGEAEVEIELQVDGDDFGEEDGACDACWSAFFALQKLGVFCWCETGSVACITPRLSTPKQLASYSSGHGAGIAVISISFSRPDKLCLCVYTLSATPAQCTAQPPPTRTQKKHAGQTHPATHSSCRVRTASVLI